MNERGGGGEGRDTGGERGGFVLFVLLCFALFIGWVQLCGWELG